MATDPGVPRMRLICGACTVMLATALTMGCRPASSTSSAPPDPAVVAAGQQKAIANIQSNPSIPPQVKANILRQMQGKFTPSALKTGTPTAAK